MEKVVLKMFIVMVFFLTANTVFAQQPQVTLPGRTSPTPNDNLQLPTVGPAQGGAGGETRTGTANCDVCGYCKGANAPDNWASCSRCMYPSLVSSGTQATEDKTLAGLPEPDSNHYYTDLGCISTDPGEFASQISRLFFSIVGGIAFLYFLYGSVVVATARSDPERLNHGKRIVYGAIIGLLFVLFSLFIIRFLAGSLGLPGIG